MSLIHWTDDLSVGIPELDEQHKRLVALVNEMVTAVMEGRGRDVLGRVLDELVAYVAIHFAAEEAYLERHAYPDLEAHRVEHAELAQQVQEVQRHYRGGATIALSLEVMRFLTSWLVRHIQGSDRKYGDFIVPRTGAE